MNSLALQSVNKTNGHMQIWGASRANHAYGDKHLALASAPTNQPNESLPCLRPLSSLESRVSNGQTSNAPPTRRSGSPARTTGDGRRSHFPELVRPASPRAGKASSAPGPRARDARRLPPTASPPPRASLEDGEGARGVVCMRSGGPGDAIAPDRARLLPDVRWLTVLVQRRRRVSVAALASPGLSWTSKAPQALQMDQIPLPV